MNRPTSDFWQGRASRAYEWMGVHQLDGVHQFCVWAPRAQAVYLIGDFNDWREDATKMEALEGGLFSATVEGAKPGQRYQYRILTAEGKAILKSDPYARQGELRPGQTSIIPSIEDETYEWTDEAWLQQRPEALAPQPINIYELHLGSWRRHRDGQVFRYDELIDELIPYLKTLHYTHVELMPLMEHPLDASWGYQVSGYYAPTRRYGNARQLKALIDALHGAGIGVILDWVPAHFPKDDFALARFDGEALYESPDEIEGQRRLWGTLVFNYEEGGVRSFLKSNAMYWIEEFHADALRVDAVSSMLYRDYDQDQYQRNERGTRYNEPAIAFLKDLNQTLREAHPQVLLFAEESSQFPAVTQSVEEGGLGFTHKWDLGWMHDNLDYFSTDYAYRPYQHQRLTFNFLYAFSERHLLPLSHDEFVYGKQALIEKMPGDYWRKCASARCLLSHLITHPGAKLLFMGQEFAQFSEWRFYESLDWQVLEYDLHQKFHRFVGTINQLYRDLPVLWKNDRDWSGFRWVEADDAERSVFAYLRMAEGEEAVLTVLNMLPSPIEYFEIGVPEAGIYDIILDSDADYFGGSNYDTGVSCEGMLARAESCSGLPYRIQFHLPPLAAIWIRRRVTSVEL